MNASGKRTDEHSFAAGRVLLFASTWAIAQSFTGIAAGIMRISMSTWSALEIERGDAQFDFSGAD